MAAVDQPRLTARVVLISLSMAFALLSAPSQLTKMRLRNHACNAIANVAADALDPGQANAYKFVPTASAPVPAPTTSMSSLVLVPLACPSAHYSPTPSADSAMIATLNVTSAVLDPPILIAMLACMLNRMALALQHALQTRSSTRLAHAATVTLNASDVARQVQLTAFFVQTSTILAHASQHVLG